MAQHTYPRFKTIKHVIYIFRLYYSFTFTPTYAAAASLVTGNHEENVYICFLVTHVFSIPSKGMSANFMMHAVTDRHGNYNDTYKGDHTLVWYFHPCNELHTWLNYKG